MSEKQFQIRFLSLITLSWLTPALIGLISLLLINLFNTRQLVSIIASPIEVIFVLASLLLALWYFNRLASPLYAFLSSANTEPQQNVIKLIRRFPVHYWSLFLAYISIMPVAIIISAEYATNFSASLIDWFRISVVILVAAILIGLPAFYLLLDLLSTLAGPSVLQKPPITIKAKIFFIGALTPFLIDTLIIHYYWTRTGYFTAETLVMWIFLELLAVAGCIIFIRSVNQSLVPLNRVINTAETGNEDIVNALPHNDRQQLASLSADLEKSNKELETFSYSVSHDLRSPLRAIRGFSEILLEDYYDKLDTNGKEYLNKVCDNTKKMAQLIDDLSALSKAISQALNPQKVNLALLATEAAASLIDTDPNRMVEFRIPDSVSAMCDERLMKIVLNSLFDNAWKYSRRNKTSKIEFGFSDQHQAYYVDDNGIGFDTQYRVKIFSPFQRLHTEDEFPGSGIGLAIVQRIIDRHHGSVWADSNMGHGSTFYFTLNAPQILNHDISSDDYVRR